VPRHGGLLEGNSKWAWLYFAGEIAAFVGYVGGLLLLRRAVVRLALVGALAAAIQLAPLGAPLLISSDAWTYWDYGRIAFVHDANPYTQPPRDFPGDPAYPHIGGAYRGTTSVYGPLFKAPGIFVNWYNEDFNRMVDEAQTIMDEKKRLAQYHRINKLWIEEMPAVPLYQQVDLYGVNKRLNWKARSDEVLQAYTMSLRDGK